MLEPTKNHVSHRSTLTEMVMSNILQLENIVCVPVIHGRCAFAQEVRRVFLQDRYDCVAVELPGSLAASVQEAAEHLPLISAVVYRESVTGYCYVPIEPGEGIMEAIRLALRERIAIAFVDMETETFAALSPALPDEYAMTQVGLPAYYESMLGYLPTPAPGSWQDQRESWMANELRHLQQEFDKILFVCGLAHWQGIRRHLQDKTPRPASHVHPEYTPQIYAVHSDSIYLTTGEIPYITFLYEKNRYDPDLKSFDKCDGIKELLLETRKEYCHDFAEETERLTLSAMQSLLYYLRNLCLLQGYLTPSLYDLIVAAQGVGGSGFAARLLEMAKFYPYQDPTVTLPEARIGIETAWLKDFGEVNAKNRLPGPPFSLKNIKLERRPRPEKKAEWKRRWGHHHECSWPEEDDRIERFTSHVKARARALLGEDLARIEKFTTSIKDGLDIRETIHQWHTHDIYVKEIPPMRGDVGAVIFIFDPNVEIYPYRITWLAEHAEESTLCFYATDPNEDIIGPGISRALYGGALFIFPPQVIPDIWKNKQFDDVQQPIEKLVAAACFYSQSKYIAYVAQSRPSLQSRSIARKNENHLLYLPISQFSAYTIRKLRIFHVLAGHHVRSYAQKYIR